MDGYVYPSEWLSTQRRRGEEYGGQQGAQDTGTHPRVGVVLESSYPPGTSFWLNPSTPGTSVRDPGTGYSQPEGNMPTQPAIPYYYGNVLSGPHGSRPERALRIVSGGSIIEPDSVFDEESGRTYQNHPTARYLFPNDPEEQDRADLQHKVFRMYNGGALYRAPVGSPRNVLEIATGTGIWAIQYATEHRQHPSLLSQLSFILRPLGIPHTIVTLRHAGRQLTQHYICS